MQCETKATIVFMIIIVLQAVIVTLHILNLEVTAFSNGFIVRLYILQENQEITL
jgi:hypothetical protein